MAWQRSALSEPPPTRWITSTSRPERADAVRTVAAKAAAMLSTMLRANAARLVGTEAPSAWISAAMRAGMSPGALSEGSFASNSGTPSETAAAAASSSARSIDAPSSPSHARTLSLSSHRPVTLCRKRYRPSTPSSWVKFASRAASVSTGSVSSSPTRPHVPHEMYAAEGDVIGTATTAEAVSCEPTAITGRSAPIRAARSGRSDPITAPGSMSGGRMRDGMPMRDASSVSHSPSSTPSNPVVEAFVRSAALTPVSRNAIRSGMSSATSASAIRSSTRYWYRVLKGRNCSPSRA